MLIIGTGLDGKMNLATLKTPHAKAICKHFRLNSIYTPQAVVNGTAQFVESDKNKMTNAIEREKK